MSECLVFSLRKKTLRENTRPYRYHGLKIFTSLKLRFQDFQRLIKSSQHSIAPCETLRHCKIQDRMTRLLHRHLHFKSCRRVRKTLFCNKNQNSLITHDSNSQIQCFFSEYGFL
ncbi:hypothetical protein BMETH_692_2 [methanotrophic bacterial endosymbiont of Bathymodiolus sp.]|nr:hypothetical protein BMETH_692_2 [methanotrophic bacterial endosymbiont of Bathymodiolus sp.]